MSQDNSEVRYITLSSGVRIRVESEKKVIDIEKEKQ